MKKLILAATSLAALTLTASAADLPNKKAAPAPVPAPLWTGFYAGVNLGGGWGANSGYATVWNSDVVNGGYTEMRAPNNVSGGVLGGLQVGYNHQLSNLFVAGGEADFQGTTMGSGGNSNSYAILPNIHNPPAIPQVKWVLGPAGGSKSIPWFGTVRGRIGITPIESVLIYGTAGFAYASIQYSTGYLPSTTQVGWTAGGGVEWAFMKNWSAKAEYLYANVSGQNSNPWGWTNSTQLTNINNNTRFNTLRAGVNYHFNIDDAAPVVAKF
jgi:outer membrane immunogenic protein